MNITSREEFNRIMNRIRRSGKGHNPYKLNKEEENKMETKSRYEVISDLEAQKRTLIRERDGLKDQVSLREKRITQIKRDLEDAELELKEFKDNLETKKETLNELIKGLDASLERFSKLNSERKS